MRAQTGILLAFMAYLFFGMQDAFNKLLVESLPVWEVLFGRSVIIVVLCVGFGRRRLVERLVTTPLKGAIAFRALVALLAWLIYYSASRDLPLAQLLTLYFAAPLMTTAMAGPLLGERVTRMQWASVTIGFVGVLVASDPFGLRLSTSALMVFAAAALWALSGVLTRKIARRESSLLQMLAANLAFTVVTGVMCLASWTQPHGLSWALLVGVGLIGGTGQFLNFEAVQRAPASVLASVQYSSLLWAFILGFLVWGDVPLPAVWAGAGLIVVAGVVLVVGERRGAS